MTDNHWFCLLRCLLGNGNIVQGEKHTYTSTMKMKRENVRKTEDETVFA